MQPASAKPLLRILLQLPAAHTHRHAQTMNALRQAGFTGSVWEGLSSLQCDSAQPAYLLFLGLGEIKAQMHWKEGSTPLTLGCVAKFYKMDVAQVFASAPLPSHQMICG
jgi:hypothetical protein